jgi:hypothetical protein
MTSVFDTAFQKRMRERIVIELKNHETTILEGKVSKFEDYKHTTGIRKGLLRAFEIMVEVEKELTSPEPGIRRNTPP